MKCILDDELPTEGKPIDMQSIFPIQHTPTQHKTSKHQISKHQISKHQISKHQDTCEVQQVLSIKIPENIRLVIDTRENHILNRLNPLPDRIESSCLGCGDFHIFCGEKLEICIERKTVSDLISSIKDKRYEKQKSRLLELQQSGVMIGYIIEGDLQIGNSPICGFSSNVYRGALINCIIRDHIFVFQTANIEETIRIIERFCTNLGKLALTAPITVEEHYFTKVTTNKQQITPENAVIWFLKSIPNVSFNVARGISLKYPTVKELVNAFSNTKTGEKMLIGFPYELNGKIKKIGKSVAERIYTFIMGNSE